tara:strand:- start:1433 stop:1852 length:420 start_codon:yes stop_codon:yes gene_type:complete
MAVNHDYYCVCGEELLDIVSDVKPKCVQCDTEMQIHYGRIVGMAQFNPHVASMYGKYHPGFGEVCESYSHKQQLLKKYNCIEAADNVGGSKTHEYPEEYQGPDHGGKGYTPRKKRGSGDTEFISDMKDLKQLEKKHGFE